MVEIKTYRVEESNFWETEEDRTGKGHELNYVEVVLATDHKARENELLDGQADDSILIADLKLQINKGRQIGWDNANKLWEGRVQKLKENILSNLQMMKPIGIPTKKFAKDIEVSDVAQMIIKEFKECGV